MNETIATPVSAEALVWNRRSLAAIAALAVLLVIGDLLFWAYEPGVSLFVFCCALNLAVVALHPAQWRSGRMALLFVVAVLAAAPMIETATPLALLLTLIGTGILSVGISGQLPKFEDWLGTATRFAVLAPARLIDDGLRGMVEGGRQKAGGKLLRGAVVWIVPAFFALVFLALFAAANPMVEQWLSIIKLDQLLGDHIAGHALLWAMLAFIAWPFLVPKLLRWTELPQRQGPVQPKAESLLFGHAAIRNSLIVFNALFAVQTVLDLIYLWGGVRLPDGMSFAGYAHRGAYPLIVTAILAGLFVLAAMRRGGPGEKSSLIRGLVFLWIGQNVWLVVSSVLRLKLYVEIYYLSEMRIAAFIWMGLVAIGLLLIIVKIVTDRSNKWLVVNNLAVLTATLWGVSFVDISGAIAQYNVRKAYEVTGEGVPLDLHYTGELGPAAIPALDLLLTNAPHASPAVLSDFRLLREELAERFWLNDTQSGWPHAWQSWSWRAERLATYLREHPFAPETGKAID